jgi:hypothetical protein
MNFRLAEAPGVTAKTGQFLTFSYRLTMNWDKPKECLILPAKPITLTPASRRV